MLSLIASAIAFVALHQGVSGTRLRGVLVARLGTFAYLALFQIASVAVLFWMGMAYSLVAGPPSTWLWDPPAGIKTLNLVIQALATVLVVGGLTTRNPGMSMSESTIDRAGVVRGVLRITRHPFLWGSALFALGHLARAPSARNMVLFGVLAFVALRGTCSIDAKRRKNIGAKWCDYEAQTSSIPFAALLRGRQSLHPHEWTWWHWR